MRNFFAEHDVLSLGVIGDCREQIEGLNNPCLVRISKLIELSYDFEGNHSYVTLRKESFGLRKEHFLHATK